MGRQVVKQGPGEMEITMKATLIQTQLLEQIVKLTILQTPLINVLKTRHGAEAPNDIVWFYVSNKAKPLSPFNLPLYKETNRQAPL